MVSGYVVVGRVTSAHGIHGRMIIEPLTENPERFEQGSILHVEGDSEVPTSVVTIRSAAPHKNKLLVSILEATDRTGAELFRGRFLYIPVSELPDPEPGEYYHHQLVGLEALDISGEKLGFVQDIVELPAQDVLIVDRSGSEYMVPFVDELINRVDLETGTVYINNIPGLFGEIGK